MLSRLLAIVLLWAWGSADAGSRQRSVTLAYLEPPKLDLYQSMPSVGLLPAGYYLTSACTITNKASDDYAPRFTQAAHGLTSSWMGWKTPMLDIEKGIIPVQPPLWMRNPFQFTDGPTVSARLAEVAKPLSKGGVSVDSVLNVVGVSGLMSLRTLLVEVESTVYSVTMELKVCARGKKLILSRDAVEKFYAIRLVTTSDEEMNEALLLLHAERALMDGVRRVLGTLQAVPNTIATSAPAGRCGDDVLDALTAGLGPAVARPILEGNQEQGKCSDGDAEQLSALIFMVNGEYEAAEVELARSADQGAPSEQTLMLKSTLRLLSRAAEGLAEYSSRKKPGSSTNSTMNGTPVTPATVGADSLPASDILQPEAPPSSTWTCPSWTQRQPLLLVQLSASSDVSACTTKLAACSKVLPPMEVKQMLDDYELTAEDLLVSDMARMVATGNAVRSVAVVSTEDSKLRVRHLHVDEAGDYQISEGCQ